MEYSDIKRFKDLLVERRQNITDWLNSTGGKDNNEIEKVKELLGQIRGALERIECESYGKCKVCLDDIEVHTLEVRPEAEVCEDCLDNDGKESLEDDLKMAGKIQRALLPQRVPDIDGFSVAVKWLPASDVGGDYYDFLPCSGDQPSRIVVADAMGKGVSAGIVISSLQGALRVLSADIRSPGELIKKLNQWLCRNVPVTKFVSLLCLCLEQTSEKETLLSYVNAGHCLPILARNDGSIERVDSTGSLLGVHEHFTFKEKTLSLYKGDFLLLYTDGITELRDSRGEMFDDERLIEYICSNRHAPFNTIIDGLMKELVAFSGKTDGLDDDVTVVALLKN